MLSAQFRQDKAAALEAECLGHAENAKKHWQSVGQLRVSLSRALDVLNFATTFASERAAISYLECQRNERLASAALMDAKATVLRLRLLSVAPALLNDPGTALNTEHSQSTSMLKTANELREHAQKLDQEIRQRMKRARAEQEDIGQNLFNPLAA
jgi:hypothetical protein